jgi:YggT family protein
MMQTFLYAFDSTLGVLRVGLFGVAAVLAVLCGVDWMVRTRKLSPFSPVARFMRNRVDPLLKPVERRVVRAGGLPSSAPWWALGTVVLTGIVLLWVLEFVRSQIAFLYASLTGGPSALAVLVISLVFTVVRFALLVRVLLSWFPMRPGAWYWRWSWALTEPILKPLRKVIPLIGMMDITPILAWFLLGIVEGLLIRAM